MLRAVDDFLRGQGRFAPDAPWRGRLRLLVAFVVCFGFFYGLAMGSWAASGGRWKQPIYSGLKLPLLFLLTFVICLPAFFVLNSLAGLRDDFGQALRGAVATQAGVTLVLAGLAPVTVFWYITYPGYNRASFCNGVMFTIATLAAQVVLRRYYRPLIARDRRHRKMLYVWFVLYVFVGIQMAWILRPYIGDPTRPTTFFRSGAWSNAYVEVLRMLGHVLKRLGR